MRRLSGEIIGAASLSTGARVNKAVYVITNDPMRIISIDKVLKITDNFDAINAIKGNNSAVMLVHIHGEAL